MIFASAFVVDFVIAFGSAELPNANEYLESSQRFADGET
jgi:hypothetical protein